MFKISSYTSDRILKVISLGLLISIIFSFRLWTSDRIFATFPMFEWLILPHWLEYSLLGILAVTLLTMILWKGKEQLLTRLVLILLVFLVMLDQMRIQPWIYFFALLLLPFSITSNLKTIFSYYRYLFAVVYIWSGIHKLNPYFESLIFQDILVHFFGEENGSLSTMANFSILIPIIEIATGILILFNRTLRTGLFLGIVIHLCILYFIVFIVYGNFVILPWNITMIFLLLVLEKKVESIYLKYIKSKILLGALLFTLVLPAGYLLGIVDQSLSFSLYDGKVNEVYIVSPETEFYDDYHKYLFENIIEEGSVISLSALSHNELKVPFYPEKRFLKKLQLEAMLSPTPKQVIITKVPIWKTSNSVVWEEKQKELLFDTKPIPFIKLKKELLIPKWSFIKSGKY